VSGSQPLHTPAWVRSRCAHAPLYENVEEFNSRTLEFLQRHSAQS